MKNEGYLHYVNRVDMVEKVVPIMVVGLKIMHC